MVSALDALLVVGILAGGALCWTGFRAYRMSDRLGRRAFVAFVAVLGTGCVAAGIVGLVLSPFSSTEQEAMWAQIPFVFWIAAMLPWLVFAVQYTGTRTRMRPRTVALLGLPLVLPLVDLTLSILTASDTFFNFLGSVVALYTFALGVAGAYLLLQKSYSYDHIPIGQGVSLSIAPLGSLILWNMIGQMDSAPGKAGAYAAGAALAAVGVGTALSRYDLFGSTPSIGTLGERALTRETDDLMFVIDDDDRVITANETAVELLDRPRSSLPGTALGDVLDHDSEQLRGAETVQIRTTRGTRQYDPQVSTVRDHLGNDIGATLSLRDVTERELREQRLAVLNRVLRHNLRNQVDVVKSNARALDGDSDQVDTIVDAADAIASFGQQARRIDGYVSRSGDHDTVDLESVVRSVLETVDVDDDITVSVDVPASATLTTNRRAIVGALESAIDNAVQYTESTVTITAEAESGGYTIRIADDGPGIPRWELESLDTGTESPLEHSTGLGLWQLKWAVTTLNGDVSFSTTDGTTVEMFVPRRTDESVPA